MLKICILLFSFSCTIPAFAQRKSNPKIGKNETEITSFIMGDDYLTYGGQLVYRLSVIKRLKIGAGILYGANSNYLASAVDRNILGYGAVFADALQFLGQRQKLGVGGQIGHGIYNDSYRKLKAGVYYSIFANYRAIVSKKVLITTSLFFGYRNFHFEGQQGSINNSALSGLKLGIVF